MNLEVVEQRCLNYLQQAENPLVPLDRLLEYCRRDEACKGLDEAALKRFCKDHERMRVIEPDTGLPGVDILGTSLEPRVVLDTRIPSQRELGVMMFDQLDRMVEALEAALTEGRRVDPESVHQLEDALRRAGALRDRLRELF
ncbi:MAG: hypothetical protein IT368_04430 [Candidatus Hydrogenedentes bacterium]|nr:hypothetical protein [Candidatus Hydrogenedentota bacterium]